MLESIGLASVLEAAMILFFGISWPLNVMRSYRSRTAKGKSILFNYFILVGYICGLTSKFMKGDYGLAFWFYWPNLIMVTIDSILYYRNKKLDRERDAAKL